MTENRPSGRKRTSSDKTAEVKKRGSGLGTGSVTNSSRPSLNITHRGPEKGPVKKEEE